jgi:hypothetical protein
MTALRLAAWWAVTAFTAACAYTAAEIPFTGPYASVAGLLAAAGVSLAGIALAPHTRKGTAK